MNPFQKPRIQKQKIEQKAPAPVSDVFFDRSQSVINLKKKKPFIEIHLGVITHFISEYRAPIGIILICFLSLSFLGTVFVSKANVATFYPSSCLGGWENVGNASGKPDLALDASIESYTKANSATLQGTGEIYCGGFKGEVPTDTRPKKFILSLRWSVDDGSIVHNAGDELLVPPASTDTNEQAVPEVLPAPENQDSTLPETIPVENPPASDQQSFIDFLIPKAFAQDGEVAPPAPEALAPEVVTPPTLPEVPPSDSSVQIDTQTDTVTQPVDTTSTPDAEVAPEVSNGETTGTQGETILPTEPEVSDAFMEILYTMDGTTWMSLSKISRTNWQGGTFEIPLASWDDINLIQIALRPLTTIDTVPTVYLESMLMTVEYEDEIPVIVEEATPLYKITEINNTSADFTLSNDGTLVVPDQILVTTTSEKIGGLAVFDTKSEVLLLNTQIAMQTYALGLSYFKEGEFTVVQTTDPDMCSTLTLNVCTDSTYFVNQASFVVINKTAPPETDTQPVIDSEISPDTRDQSATTDTSSLPEIPNTPTLPDTVLNVLNSFDIPTLPESSSTENTLPPVDTAQGEALTF